MNRRELLAWTFWGAAVPLALRTNDALGATCFSEGAVYDVDVLNLDGKPDSDGEIFDHSTTLVYQNSLPVLLQGAHNPEAPENLVGMATMSLFKSGRNRYLRAYMNLNGAPEDVRKALPYLFPSVAGTVQRRDGKLYKHVEIRAIHLHSSANSDKRIKRLGDR